MLKYSHPPFVREGERQDYDSAQLSDLRERELLVNERRVNNIYTYTYT